MLHFFALCFMNTKQNKGAFLEHDFLEHMENKCVPQDKKKMALKVRTPKDAQRITDPDTQTDRHGDRVRVYVIGLCRCAPEHMVCVISRHTQAVLGVS